MATSFEALFGTDIRLLGDLEHAEQRERGSDLFIGIRPESSRVDLQRLSGVPDLQQALLLRFLTQVGELEHLGHAGYGSRLHELVGDPNTETTRNRAKLYALQALQAEPRVSQIRSIVVETRRDRPNQIDIKAAVVAIDSATPVNLVFPVVLDGGTA
jgi:phage baseplate assembly protein W